MSVWQGRRPARLPFWGSKPVTASLSKTPTSDVPDRSRPISFGKSMSRKLPSLLMSLYCRWSGKETLSCMRS